MHNLDLRLKEATLVLGILEHLFVKFTLAFKEFALAVFTVIVDTS